MNTMSDTESIIDVPEDQDDEVEIIQELEEQTGLAESPADEAQEVTADNDNPADGVATKVVKPKRVIRNPQPKLNEQTLKGPRGLPVLESYFEHVKFKGAGHEEEDLNVMMKTYGHWCHRLFPKFPFDACIERLEKLGTKRATQTLVKRIRMGIEIEDDEKAPQSEEEPVAETGIIDARDSEFDRLFGTETSQEPNPTADELLERIRQNKERAQKLREERLRKMGVNTQMSQTLEAGFGPISDTVNNDEELPATSGNLKSQDLPEEDKSRKHIEKDSDEVHSEILERIRQNRERAQKLRDERLRQIRDKVSDETQGSQTVYIEDILNEVNGNEEKSDTSAANIGNRNLPIESLHQNLRERTRQNNENSPTEREVGTSQNVENNKTHNSEPPSQGLTFNGTGDEIEEVDFDHILNEVNNSDDEEMFEAPTDVGKQNLPTENDVEMNMDCEVNVLNAEVDKEVLSSKTLDRYGVLERQMDVESGDKSLENSFTTNSGDLANRDDCKNKQVGDSEESKRVTNKLNGVTV